MNEELLSRFEYSIISSPVVMPQGNLKQEYVRTLHLPLFSIRVDFEKGMLCAEGDWHYMAAYNKRSELHWYSFYTGRVSVEARLHKAFTVNLEDNRSDGMVFPFKGKIKDGAVSNSCSGLLVINKDNREGGLADEWSIVLYLYDYQFDSCEIIFKLPLYIHSVNADLN